METTTGNRIRTLRLKQRLSQAVLAEKARAYAPSDRILVRESISRIENGRSRADAWVVLALAKALGVSAEYLFGNTDDPSVSSEPVFPVPEPEIWDFVARLNRLPPTLRVKTVTLFGELLGLTDGPTAAPAPSHPIPDPDFWDLVQRLNSLPAPLRPRVVALINELLSLAGSD